MTNPNQPPTPPAVTDEMVEAAITEMLESVMFGSAENTIKVCPELAAAHAKLLALIARARTPETATPVPGRLHAAAQAVSQSRRVEKHMGEVFVHYEVDEATVLELRAALAAAPTPAATDAWDFLAHLRRQREWSERTFGPGHRTLGVIDHIHKELAEIKKEWEKPDAAEDVSAMRACDYGALLAEWIDVVILALDGAWRSGASPEQIIGALRAKQAKNEARKWPDWRTMSPDAAIEHDRTHEAPPAPAPKPGPDLDAWPLDRVKRLCESVDRIESLLRRHFPS